MKKRIHVNQHVIKSNQKTGSTDAALAVQTSNGTFRSHQAHIQGPSQVIYRPEKALKCGARVWVEVADGVPVQLIDLEGNVTEELI